jgi:hypothetical protein
MEPQAVPSVVPGRACGSCAMCCKLPFIPELQKPLGVWCKHVALGKGCTIYGDRPRSCRSFYCLWMLDRGLGPEWKPDRAKFMLYLQGNSANIQVAVDQNFPNAWRKEPYYRELKRWSREGAEQGRFVFVRVGSRLFVLLPDRDADIGEVQQDDDVVVSRKFTPAGFEYAVEVVPRRTIGA